jgi:hypothetical protein
MLASLELSVALRKATLEALELKVLREADAGRRYGC